MSDLDLRIPVCKHRASNDVYWAQEDVLHIRNHEYETYIVSISKLTLNYLRSVLYRACIC